MEVSPFFYICQSMALTSHSPENPVPQSRAQCRSMMQARQHARKSQPWHVTKAIMWEDEDADERVPEMVGLITTQIPTAGGLLMNMWILHSRRNHGYGAAALRLWLEAYWREKRIAPWGELFCDKDKTAHAWFRQEKLRRREPTEVKHLVVAASPQNVACHRLMAGIEAVRIHKAEGGPVTGSRWLYQVDDPRLSMYNEWVEVGAPAVATT